jgi:hypothetical protein
MDLVPPARRVFQIGLIAALCTVAPALALPSAGSGDVPPTPVGLSVDEWTELQAAHRVQRQAFRAAGDGHVAVHLAQAWTAAFDGRGVLVTSDQGAWAWGLELRSAQGLGKAARARVRRVDPSRLCYDWSEALEEWYVQDERGLEHGFTVRRPPAGLPAEPQGSLTLELALRGELRARVCGSGRDVTFEDAQGNAAIRYGGLLAFDADRVALPASIEAVEGGLRIVVQACGARYPITIDPWVQQAYLKASNTDSFDVFGESLDVSGDTAVIGADEEDSNATGVNGDGSNNLAARSGAAYVYVRTGGTWSFQAYLKASNTQTQDHFGRTVAISGDTIVVGAHGEDSAATGVDGDQADNGAPRAGAAYIFARSGSSWAQQAYLKASNTGTLDDFGFSVDVSGDTAIVGAVGEDSRSTGVNGDGTSNTSIDSGAAYVFVRNGTTWSQQAYLKASNAGPLDLLGWSVGLSGDTAVIGAPEEDSSAIGVDGDGQNNDLLESGAAYAFVRSGTTWSQQAYLKASNTGLWDWFGHSVAVSGNTIAVGALREDSHSSGVNGDQLDNSLAESGAVYVFERAGSTWTQQAYLKAINSDRGDVFGIAVAVSGDLIAVGARGEDGSAAGLGGVPDEAASDAGAAYVFQRAGSTWSPGPYVKASNTGSSDRFGTSVALSGGLLLVGATGEDSSATGVGGDQFDEGAAASGAAYAIGLDVGVTSYCTQTKPTSVPGCTALLTVTDATLSDGEWESTSIPRDSASGDGTSLGIYIYMHGLGIGPSAFSVTIPYGTLCLQGFERSAPACAPATLFVQGGTCGSGIMRLALDCGANALGIAVGDDVNVQLWYRDPMPAVPDNANFSNAVFYTVQ